MAISKRKVKVEDEEKATPVVPPLDSLPPDHYDRADFYDPTSEAELRGWRKAGSPCAEGAGGEDGGDDFEVVGVVRRGQAQTFAESINTSSWPTTPEDNGTLLGGYLFELDGPSLPTLRPELSNDTTIMHPFILHLPRVGAGASASQATTGPQGMSLVAWVYAAVAMPQRGDVKPVISNDGHTAAYQDQGAAHPAARKVRAICSLLYLLPGLVTVNVPAPPIPHITNALVQLAEAASAPLSRVSHPRTLSWHVMASALIAASQTLGERLGSPSQPPRSESTDADAFVLGSGSPVVRGVCDMVGDGPVDTGSRALVRELSRTIAAEIAKLPLVALLPE